MRPSDSRSLHVFSWICAALIVAWSATEAARAFFPTNLLAVGGLLGRSHVKITSDAIEELDAEFFALPKLTKSMKKAIEQIADANAEVDQDQVTSAKHFDAESFPEGQARLATLLTSIQNALAADDATGARAALGGALHTIQDFYSHSNWVELGNGGPHPGLGRPASIGRLPATTATCQACTGGLPPILCPNCSNNLITGALTSGYYSGEDRVKPNANKCSHGGVFDGSASGLFGEGINKDSFDCTFSPHNFLHSSAAAVAKEATKQFIRDIKALVTERQLKLLLGVGPTLAISIDTTGSMGGIINSVKAQAIQIVELPARHRRRTVEVRARAVQRPRRGSDDGHHRCGRVQGRDQRPVRVGRRRLPRALDERHAPGAQRVGRGRRPLHVHRRELARRRSSPATSPASRRRKRSRSTRWRSAAARRSIPAIT